MAHIHYKFSSKLSYDTVVFDGPHITLTDLKRRIMGREKLRAADCDLQITNAQTKEEYTEDEELIPKGSSVIVRRIPISGVKSSSSSKTPNIERSHGQAQHIFGASRAQMEDHSSTKALSFFAKMQMANLVDADVPEEDKIKFMMNQSSYSTMNLNTKLGTVLPENYTCFRCGNAGHHIRNCPTSGDKSFEAPQRLKKSTGIPRSFMVEVDDPNIKGVMVTNCGRYAIPAIDAEAYAIGKKERPPFVPQEQPKSESEEEPVPDELLCLICHDLLDDAVVIHCCGNSYCDDCIRTSLLDSEDHVCPTCGQSSVSPDSLTANKFLRQAVNNFKKERVGVKSSRKKPAIAPALNSTPIPGPAPPPPTLKKLLQPPLMQQDSPLNPLKASKMSSSSRAPDVVVPAAADTACANGSSKSFPPLAQSHATAEPETEGKNVSSSVSSDKDPTDDLSKLVSEVSQTQGTEVKEKPSSTASTDPVMTLSSSWDGSTLSSSGFSSGALTESNSQQLRNASSSSSPSFSFLSPFCPNSLASAPIATHQPTNTYPPGYQPATNTWTLPPRDAPPSALNPKEWYGYHRNERDRPSLCHSNLKTSQSYPLSSTHCRSSQRDSLPRSYPTTYSFGYKRPPSSTSSSSSPCGGYHSRSSSDQQKSRHHPRHPHKGSALRSRSSRRRGERSGRETGGPLRAHADAANSRLELDVQLYLQWRKEFQDWYDKYYAHFHQLPFPPPPLPPHPQESHDSGRTCSRKNDQSPLSRHSSFSRSPSSQSSTDSRSTTSRSSSDSRSDKASEGHSPPSRTSSSDLRTPSDDKSQLRELPESSTEKNTEIPQQKPGVKQQLSPQTHNQREEKGFQRRGRDGGSSPDQNRGENQTEKTSSNPSDSIQPHTKLEKLSDKEKEQERKSKEEKRLQINQSRKRESREKEREEKNQRIQSSSKTETVRAEDKKIMRKRKREDSDNIEKSGPQSSTSQKATENPGSNRNKKSPTPSDRKKKKVEKERTSLTKQGIWEGGMKVMPQKKISININLEGKVKERNDEEKSSGFDMNVEEKTADADGGEENQDGEKTENRTDEPKDSNAEDKKQIELNERKDCKEEKCEKKFEEEKNRTEKEDLDLWHCALSTAGEDETGKEASGDQKGDNLVQAEPRSREAAGKRLHQAQKKSRDDGSSFSVEGSCGGEGRLEKKRTGKKEEDNGQERDEATQSESTKVPCVEQQKNEQEEGGGIKMDSSSISVDLPDCSEPNNMEAGEQSKRQEQQRGRDNGLASSSGRKRSLSPNRKEERRERSSRRRENDTQQESKRLKSGMREDERRKSTSVPKRNLPSLLSHDAERRAQQQNRGGHSSRKTSCTYKERESSSIDEGSSFPYQGASKTERDNDRFLRTPYHSSVNQREARSHHSPPPLFHFHSFSSLPRGGPHWPSTQRKSRDEKVERRSDGGQLGSKERKSRRDEEERQRPGRSGDARSSESSRGKKHKRETSHNCRSQTREMQM